MKNIKDKIIVYFLTFICLVYACCGSYMKVYASGGVVHEQGDNIVYKEAVTLEANNNSNYQWGYTRDDGFYVYKIDDATGIPTGSVINGMTFFKYGDNNKFGAIASSQFIALIVNRGLGLVLSDEKLQAFYTAYLANISSGGNNKAGSLVDSQGNVLGYCLNDISGCVYDAYPQNQDIQIPSTEVNNVYNYYQYYIQNVDHQVPDYINVQTYNTNEALLQLDVSNSYTQSLTAIVNDVGNGLCLSFYQSGTTKKFRYPAGSTNGLYYKDISNCTAYVPSTSSSYDNFCLTRGLVQNGDEVGYTSLIGTANTSLTVTFYDNNDNSINLDYVRYAAASGSSNYTQTNQTETGGTYLCGPNYIPMTKTSQVITVYKNSATFTSVVNKTYAPSTFTSTTYNNYNTTSDNSISTNSSVVNNSTTTNQTIYNDASQQFSDYYSNSENYNIDNSVVIEQNTTIINNYYGDSGGGGGGDDDDDDDDLIWKTLLKAIADFFKKIGELIATVLTGIVTIFTSILDAIASITSDFTAITDFFGQIFGWLPSDIVTLMTLGLAMALFAAFISWFKK